MRARSILHWLTLFAMAGAGSAGFLCGVASMFRPDLDVHSLRQTVATLLARGSVSPTVAQKLMQYSDIRLMMNTYAHIDLSDTTGAAAGLGGV